MSDLTKIYVSKLSVSTFYDAKTRCSFCWKYFGNLIVFEGNKKRILNSDKVYCLACLNDVKKESEDISFGSVKIKSYNRTVSTGNLTRHLRDDHQIREEDDRDVKAKIKKVVKELFTVTRPAKSKNASSASPGKGPSRINKRRLARDLALWFCKSLLPFDSVSDEGMVDFFQKYNIIVNEEDMPSRNTVNVSALSEVYESILNKVKENISIDAAMHFAITFDLWKDPSRRLRYVTIALYYLTSDFVLKAITLNTEILIGNDTEEKIKKTIEDLKERFDLEDKNVVAVISAEENIKRAVLLENMPHHLCLGHGLHNLVTIDGINAVPEIATLVKKLKKIVKAVSYRAPELQANANQEQSEFLSSLEKEVEMIENDENDPISENKLIKLENNEDFQEHTLLSASGSNYFQDIPTSETAIPTRWHIVLEMLESVIHNCDRDTLYNMLCQINQDKLMITQREWIILESLVVFLKSFREAVEIMLSQQTCTINVALVFRSEIIDVLNTVQDDESLFMSNLKRNMLANIDKRFPVNKTLVAAALIDCRFMGLREVDIFLEKQSMTRASFLSSYIREVLSVNDIPETNRATTSTNSDKKENTSLLQKLSKKHSISPCQSIQDDPVEQECWRYIAAADPTEPKDGDLLSYWNSKKEAFPYLSSLARAILCIPATSISSERMFSDAGLKITAKRSRLNPSRVNKILFVHDNYYDTNKSQNK